MAATPRRRRPGAWVVEPGARAQEPSPDERRLIERGWTITVHHHEEGRPGSVEEAESPVRRSARLRPPTPAAGAELMDLDATVPSCESAPGDLLQPRTLDFSDDEQAPRAQHILFLDDEELPPLPYEAGDGGKRAPAASAGRAALPDGPEENAAPLGEIEGGAALPGEPEEEPMFTQSNDMEKFAIWRRYTEQLSELSQRRWGARELKNKLDSFADRARRIITRRRKSWRMDALIGRDMHKLRHPPGSRYITYEFEDENRVLAAVRRQAEAHFKKNPIPGPATPYYPATRADLEELVALVLRPEFSEFAGRPAAPRIEAERKKLKAAAAAELAAIGVTEDPSFFKGG